MKERSKGGGGERVGQEGVVKLVAYSQARGRRIGKHGEEEAAGGAHKLSGEWLLSVLFIYL